MVWGVLFYFVGNFRTISLKKMFALNISFGLDHPKWEKTVFSSIFLIVWGCSRFKKIACWKWKKTTWNLYDPRKAFSIHHLSSLSNICATRLRSLSGALNRVPETKNGCHIALKLEQSSCAEIPNNFIQDTYSVSFEISHMWKNFSWSRFLVSCHLFEKYCVMPGFSSTNWFSNEFLYLLFY